MENKRTDITLADIKEWKEELEKANTLKSKREYKIFLYGTEEQTKKLMDIFYNYMREAGMKIQ